MNEKVLGSTVRIDLTTHDTTGALAAPSSAFAAADFRVYKDGSASEKTTTNGITVTSPFDSITGKHLVEIDTNNSTGDSGFWAAGSEYRVEINSAKTISSVVQSGVTVGRFRLVSADVLRSDGYTAPANSDIAAAKEAAESIAEMLPNTDFLAGAATDEGAAVLNAETLNSIRSGLATSSQVAAITSQAINTVTRSVDDTNPLTFNWPVSGATITATRSINNAAYGAVAGAIAFLRTEGTKHYYTLAHNAADRPTAEGTVRYKFDDGTYTRYVVMAVATAGLGDDTLAQLQSIEDSVDANTGYLTTVLDRIPAALFAGVTSMGDWLRRVFRKDAGTAGMIAAEGEINTGGTSTFDGETDNLERIYEVAGTGGGGGGATATEIADAILVRDWTAVSGSVPSRSVLNALRHIRNKWALDGTTKTVYAEDGTTPAFTTTVTADGAGNITADTPND